MAFYGKINLYNRSLIRTVRKQSTAAKDILSGLNLEIQNGGIVPPFKLAPVFRERIAIQDSHGKFSYDNLFKSAKALSNRIVEELHGKQQKTITYLCNGDSTHVITQWAIWMSGNVAVPLCLQHPPPLLEHFVHDSGSSLIICDEKFKKRISEALEKKIRVLQFSSPLNLPDTDADASNENYNYLEDIPDGKFYANSDALIIYTSGTTSKPKGVVHGYNSLASQVASLHSAWKYSANDVVLHTLPLHHIHGQINSISATLSCGGMLKMLTSFNPVSVWSHLLGMEKDLHRRVSVFMGVPTMYNKLIDEYDRVLAKSSSQREYIKNILMMKMRLMICGSAPLPVPTFERWEDITGHRLLERYGMTEVGMAISNPYDPINERTPGFVGEPLPGVSIKIASIDPSKNITPIATLESPPPSLQFDLKKFNITNDISTKNLFEDENIEVDKAKKCKITIHQEKKDEENRLEGELLVKGANLFNRYWNQPEHTKSEFTSDGWFITGDTAALENGKVKVLGRTSLDIIKSGGFKISAVEVETLILGHPSIVDAAVLGLPDVTWGEMVVAVVELQEGTNITLKELQDWGLKFAPRHQLPSRIFIVSKIQRNLLGKVNKKELAETLKKKLQN